MRLRDPGQLNLELIEGICKSRQVSAVVEGFKFSIIEAAVARLIGGDGKDLISVAANRLCFRLGIKRSSYVAFDQTGIMHDSCGGEFNMASVAKYHKKVRKGISEDIKAGWKVGRIELGMMYPDKVVMRD